MEVVAATHNLRIGGSQGYLVLMAEQLERLGHRVTLHAAEHEGPLADFATGRGVRVARTESALPATCDVALVQDGMMSHRLAEVYPATPQVFRCPSELFDLQLPPQITGQVAATIALSERVAQRLRALAVTGEVIRLTQPIDTFRFAGGESLRKSPRRALLLGNYLEGDRRDMLVESWAAAGVECSIVGDRAEPTIEPEAVIADADIVVAKGRAALEAMSCGRAVYIYDRFGGDGWVTAESYPVLEADNFAGQATGALPSRDRLLEDLAGYDAEMGIRNRDLVVRNHCARRHAEALVGVLAGVAPRADAPATPNGELARLVRVQWQTELRGFGLAAENRRLLARLREAERGRRAAEAERDRTAAREASRLDELRRARRAERELERVTALPALRLARAAKRMLTARRRRSPSS